MTAIPVHHWVFPARIERVIDADTLSLVIDVGLHGRRIERIRLLGVDAPEKRGVSRIAGLAAQAWVQTWLDQAGLQDWPLVVQTIKDPDHFGRYLGSVYRTVDYHCLNEDLLAAGIAKVYQ